MEVRKLKLAVSGLTGAGKSTILNAIAGREVFTEGDHLHHETTQVTPYTWQDEDNNYEVTVYDTPGFEDETNDAEKYKQDIRNHCSDVDLLLYCISVEEVRPMLRRDKKTLKELQQVFDPSVWNHCVVVLTFSNAIVTRLQARHRSRLNAKARVKSDYHEATELWKKEIRTILKECLEEEEVCADIPIIPAGSASCYSILNNNQYWLSDLFREVLEVTDDCKSDVLIMLNSHRFRSSSEIKSGEFKDVRITEQPLVIHEDFNKLIKRLKGLGAAFGAGSITGAVGAGVGATIGALAIGIPTFGVAAGVGLLLGAAIGGGIGIGVGVGVYKIIDKFEEQKHTLDKNVVVRIEFGFM